MAELTSTIYTIPSDDLTLTTTVTSDVLEAHKWILRVMNTEKKSVIVGVEFWGNSESRKDNYISSIGFIVDHSILIFRLSKTHNPPALKWFFHDVRFTFVGLEMKRRLKRLESKFHIGIPGKVINDKIPTRYEFDEYGELVDHRIPLLKYEDLGKLAEEIYQVYLDRPINVSLAKVAKLVFGERFCGFKKKGELLDDKAWAENLNEGIVSYASTELFVIQQIAYNLGAGLYDRTGFLRVPRRTSRTTVPVSRRMRIQPHDEFNNTTDPRKRAQQEVEKARKERLLRNFDSYTNLLQMYFESKGSTQDRLRRASQERDEAWQLELDAVLKLQSLDSTTSDDTGSPRLSIMEPRMVAESETGSLDGLQRTCPTATRTAHQFKMLESEADSPSPNSLGRTPKERNLKVAERKSPRSPETERRKLPCKVTDIEPQLAQLQDDLKKVKDQLGLCESQRKYAQQEAEKAHKRLKSLTSKLDESHRQLLELTSTEDDRLQELQRCTESEAQAKMLVGETLMQLETAKLTMDTLRSENFRAKQAYDSLASELEQSRRQLNALETLRKHQGDPFSDLLVSQRSSDNSNILESDRLRMELSSARLEVEQLRNALETAKHEAATRKKNMFKRIIHGGRRFFRRKLKINPLRRRLEYRGRGGNE